LFGVVLDNCGSPGDAPVSWTAQTSMNGTNFTTVASGSGGNGSQDCIIEIEFDQTTARFVRVVQNGSQNNWWSIHRASVDMINQAGQGERLSRNNWSVTTSINNAGANAMIDGNSSTRWTTTQSQREGQFIEIDFGGQIDRINEIELQSEASRDDYPREYAVSFSSDGGNSFGNEFVGTGSQGTTFIFTPRSTATHMRIEQTGFTNRLWWSIHEINVLR